MRYRNEFYLMSVYTPPATPTPTTPTTPTSATPNASPATPRKPRRLTRSNSDSGYSDNGGQQQQLLQQQQQQQLQQLQQQQQQQQQQLQRQLLQQQHQQTQQQQQQQRIPGKGAAGSSAGGVHSASASASSASASVSASASSSTAVFNGVGGQKSRKTSSAASRTTQTSAASSSSKSTKGKLYTARTASGTAFGPKFTQSNDGHTPEARALAEKAKKQLESLKEAMEAALVQQIADDFIDITTPLKHLTDAAHAPGNDRNRLNNFVDKASAFESHSNRLAGISKRAASSGGCADKWMVDSINAQANLIQELTPQVVYAGRVVLENPDNPSADEHFKLLKEQWSEGMDKLRCHVDASMDTVSFIKASEDGIRRDTAKTEAAIGQADSLGVVNCTSSIARKANRVLQVANQEAENSEDPAFVERVQKAYSTLRETISPEIQIAKVLAVQIRDPAAAEKWRTTNSNLIGAVAGVRLAVAAPPPASLPPAPPVDLGQLSIQDSLPVHQPLSVLVDNSQLLPNGPSHPSQPHQQKQPQQQPNRKLSDNKQNQQMKGGGGGGGGRSRYRTDVYLPDFGGATSPDGELQQQIPPVEFRFGMQDLMGVSPAGPLDLVSQGLSPRDPNAYSPRSPNAQGCFAGSGGSSSATRSRTTSRGESGGADSFGYPPILVNDPLPPNDPFPPRRKMPRSPDTAAAAAAASAAGPDSRLGPLSLNVGHEPRGFGGARGPHGGSLLAMAVPPNDSNSSPRKDPPPPPRPPPPEQTAPPRPPSPVEGETEEIFSQVPQSNQPIMQAAHALHEEVRQWESRDNDLIQSAKRMALLMAKLSQLVRGEGGTKKDLIATSKQLADASREVTKLAKELAKECTDKRMRTNLLQVCERIPTIGTQLKILSTVKATMLGAQGSEEDQEATEMLVGNAQNLMLSVKETVRAAEAASIKIRTDSGYMMRWIRKRPWYT